MIAAGNTAVDEMPNKVENEMDVLNGIQMSFISVTLTCTSVVPPAGHVIGLVMMLIFAALVENWATPVADTYST